MFMGVYVVSRSMMLFDKIIKTSILECEVRFSFGYQSGVEDFPSWSKANN